MKLRKLVSVAMAGVMTLSLAACGGSKTAETTAAPDTTAAVESSASAGGAEQRRTPLRRMQGRQRPKRQRLQAVLQRKT